MPAPMADDDQPPLIALDDRQDADVDLEGLMTLARATLLGEGIADAELSISFVTEEEIAGLHERYLHEAGPTDVLSFPLDDEAGEDGLRQLGDVVIAPAVAAAYGRPQALAWNIGTPGGRRPEQPGRSGGRAPAAARPRHPAPARARSHERWRESRDVGAPGALLGGAGPVTAADWALLGVVVVLIGVSAVFAAAETFITRVSKVRAYRLQEEGRRGAASLVKIVENPPPYLNVVLLLMLAVHLAGTTVATVVAVRTIGDLGELIATVVMTFLLFVFAEVAPKTYAVLQTDRVALRLAPATVALTRVIGPLTSGLIKLSNVVMPGKGLPEGPFATEEEIKAMASVASDEEQIEEGEKELIHSIFEFGDTIVREVMLPRPDITAIEADKALRDVQALVLQHGYSRIPVFEDDLDQVTGIVYAKDVLKALHQGKNDMPLSEIVREAHFVPESKKVADLLREMQKEKFHIALVTDEYGSVVGLITLEDLLEELVGEITDEYDTEEPELEQVADDVYRVDGKLSIDEVNELLDVELPDEEWDTVGGLMLGLLGSIPDEGEEVSFRNLRFTAERVDGRRISKVLITREEQPEPTTEEQEVRAE